MIKKEKTSKTRSEVNPYLFYITNWGFIDTEIETANTATKKQNQKVEK